MASKSRWMLVMELQEEEEEAADWLCQTQTKQKQPIRSFLLEIVRSINATTYVRYLRYATLRSPLYPPSFARTRSKHHLINDQSRAMGSVSHRNTGTFERAALVRESAPSVARVR